MALLVAGDKLLVIFCALCICLLVCCGRIFIWIIVKSLKKF